MNSFRKQRTLAMMTGFERYTKKTRRAIFLEEMEQVVPWAKLCAWIEPHYPKPGNGRRPKELEKMLRIYFLQQWFNLADPEVEEALYDSAMLRQFAGIDLGAEPVPDETTVCKFRHLLKEHNLGEEILGTVNLHLQTKGVRITTGTIVDATLIHAPSSNQKPRAEPRSGDAPGEEGEELVEVAPADSVLALIRHAAQREGRILIRSGLVVVFVLAIAGALGPAQSVGSSENSSASAQKQEGRQALRTREFLGLGRQPDSQLANEGAKIFGPACGFCHGAGGRGGTGPDLLRSPVVLDDDKGELIGPAIQNGRLSRGMPAFSALTEEQLRAIAEFLHMQVELAANRGTYQVHNIVTGNAQAGEAYFNGEGKCNACHSVNGDLAHIGSKLSPLDLQAVELYPEARTYDFGGTHPPRQVTVILADGKKLTGSLKHLDDFYVSFEDDQGQYHSIAITKGVKAVVEDKLVFHRKMLDHYTDKQIHDLTAYLVTLK